MQRKKQCPGPQQLPEPFSVTHFLGMGIRVVQWLGGKEA